MFFGIDWAAAVVKASFQVVFAIVFGLIFWICWNSVAPIYFTFLPVLWLNLPYWITVKMVLIIGFLGEMINKLTPKIISVNNSNTNS